jgi:hypothetical protein
MLSYAVYAAPPVLAAALVFWVIAKVIRNYRSGGDAYKQEVESRRASRQATPPHMTP